MREIFLLVILLIGVWGIVTKGMDVQHRSGALFVRRGSVSISGSTYRVLLHIHPYIYDSEIAAMDTFLSNSSSLLTNLKAKINAAPDSYRVLLNTMNAFEVQITRATETRTALVAKNNVLKELFPNPLPDATSSVMSANNRPFRQESVANFFGLASYSQVRDLQNWAENAAEKSERIVHAVDQQYTFINKTAHRVNQQESRLNQLTELAEEYNSQISKLTDSTATLQVLQNIQDTMLSLLKGSLTLLEFTAELRLLLDEEIDRAHDLIRGKVPLSLLSPSEFHQIMKNARDQLPSTYSFSATPSDMALSLASAAITVITKGQVMPYYGVIEFPIHGEVYQLYQVLPVRVTGLNDPSITGQFEIDNSLLAVRDNYYFSLTSDRLENCLRGQMSRSQDYSSHFCTAVTSVFRFDTELPPSTCAAAI